ncbi:MAG: nucleoside hydrolase [Ignavibacteriales bacterium]|nr:nucleoside hydrolase [Ignavibacteriales bacterium]
MSSVGHSKTEKLLLDTDIGTDIDDAVCLAYLLAHPECDLLGITTVTGEPEKRAMLASAICRQAGREVPIYPGAEHPMKVLLKQKIAQQAEVLGNWAHETKFPSGEAVEFLRRTIRAHPGEITLLTIAPLTNIGLLFSKDPEIPRLLKRLVMMCGRFFEPIPDGYSALEWNAIGDPHASDIVYRSSVKLHRSVGIDVTSKVVMSADEFPNTFRDEPLFQPILDFAEIWFKDFSGTTFHDPLAAATIFDDVCQFQRGTVDIELQEGENQGLTRWSPDSKGRHEVAVNVDAPHFFEHYLSTIRQAEK